MILIGQIVKTGQMVCLKVNQHWETVIQGLGRLGRDLLQDPLNTLKPNHIGKNYVHVLCRLQDKVVTA